MTKKSRFARVLDTIEVVGNRLPHPATLFFIMAVLVALLSWLAASFDLQAAHPATGEIIKVKNLLSADGIRWIYTNVEHNFVKFPPLGLVLVIMIGIGVAEGSGLFTVLVRQLVLGAPKSLITSAIIVAGIFSHLASEVGYVILIPLGAMIFHALGRHPMAGFAAAFAGVSAGFGSNFLIGSVDPILAGLSTSAAQIIDAEMNINPMVNYFFMVVSAVMVTIVGTWITEKIVEPRLGKYTGTEKPLEIEQITPLERKGLRWAGYGTLIFIALMAWTIIPENGLLRDPETGGILRSPFFAGIVVGLLLLFFVPGLIYGIIVKTIKSDKDVVKHMTHSMKGLGGYIVLVFFAAQFIYWFNYSNLGLVVAIDGAEFLSHIGFTGIPLIIAFVILAAFLNMFMGSASAKWAIMAPVFIPMFMILGYHPGLTQAAFRIGDSVTNVITPMMSYFALIVTYAQKYDEKNGIGTIISLMIPYTTIFMIVWVIMMSLWIWIGIPVGFDGPVYLP
ncbi:MAG: aminobenzoyl-glutamate transporter [Bacteroidetes bacterium GWE2_39_28]|nr:MAG: aminobenzoyl-glutamate transporter [Bacteroidetes bacterium GWE2_39_28]OFY14857.1 MAG: aminobenzoyl-glutamate transporter [Bacteroidetes bacterium GWF2_39_10]OFZ09043.1 MAG: aminobenzoyl-glutamate transporter [Bacteroidetes bacterium RIFOXYB2_FULL_39_7]OFZ10716.1 MAG: aminobenzoyl-glutamate transporter [Bacteroidetes bacterium RIFOXYC2_FULL_39_11]HCT93214.1 aminobenzoyl-glutamate transporter [Rikenellaceae bacterium]